MIIDCISDLHGHYPKLEGGDLLIVAGDLTAMDTQENHFKFLCWVDKLDYKKKIVIAGNHDNLVQKHGVVGDNGAFEYLCDSGAEFEYWDGLTQDPDPKVWLDSIYADRKKKLKIYGSPWTKTFPGMNPKCKAFTVDTEEELAEKWALIPDDTDILITHSPPYGIFDAVLRETKWGNGTECTGSISLRNLVMGPLRPQLHVFGHIHEWGGKMIDTCVTKFVNASHVNERYQPVHPPIRIEL